MGTSSWNFLKYDFHFKIGGLLICFSKHVQGRMKETINEGDKIIRNEYENRVSILPLCDC
jgi:hypothetical protein